MEPTAFSLLVFIFICLFEYPRSIIEKAMKYKDKVYGEVEIKEPIILDLINCPTIQRLKEIDQAGYSEPFIPGSKRTRFEHSIGVYLLLRKFGASIEEQISGLIHDASHSAFSHCIDYVLDAGSEKEHSHQDNIFDEYVKNSEIPEIINKYGFDMNYILDDSNFLLKENDLPDICADRIDYSLRDAIAYKELSDASYFFDNLTVVGDRWVFNDFTCAKKYAELFLMLNDNYWSGILASVMFLTISDYLKYALKQGYITETDLYTTDKIVLDKVEPHIKDDSKLKLLYDRLNNRISYRNSPDNYDGKVFCKSRVVDPFCRHNGEIVKVSDVELNWSEIIQKGLNPKSYCLKFDK